MSYLGDFALGQTFDTAFTTRQISGAPFTLAGSPVISAYPANSTTELTAGITLTVDFDSRTGLNHVRVVATSGNGYATATDYQLVITTGTVNSVSVVGEVIGEFSIQNRVTGAPAGASLAADIAAIKAETAEIDAVTDQLTFTVANQIDANVLDWKSATAPAMTGDAFARLGAPAGASVSADVAAIKAETAEIDAVADQFVFSVANQVDANVIDWKGATAPAMTGDAFARLGAPAGASVSADIAAVKTETAEIDAIVDLLPNGGALSNLDAAVSSRATPAQILTTALTEAYAADGAAPTLSQLGFMIWSMLAEANASGVTITTKKLDGSTAAMTFTIDNASTPSTITRAS